MVSHLVPWNVRTSSVFDTLRREMDDFVGRLQESNRREGTAWFAPSTNIAESDKGYEITIDLPGLTSEDFDLEFQDGNLTVTGTRKDETEEKGKTFHRIERKYGEFRRSFALGRDIDADKVEAEYSAGVLRILVPKAEEVRPKKITVKS